MIFLCCVAIGTLAGEPYQAPHREPTAEETYILELMNRFRADPAAEAVRVAPGGDKIDGYMGEGIDWEMFKAEVRALKAAPPLVFNLDLLDAARKHSHYMIRNDLTHSEDPTLPGFFGASMVDRFRKSGYELHAAAENCFRDASNLLHAHAAFILDFGGGAGGMQTNRGHRTNMANASYREVGAAVLPHEDQFSVTYDFGNREAPRFAGGVVYDDKNKNGFYDIGEGVGGAKITADDGSTISTWKSGAYTLELKSTKPVTLTATFNGQSYSRKFDVGRENIKFDWIIQQKSAEAKSNEPEKTGGK